MKKFIAFSSLFFLLQSMMIPSLIIPENLAKEELYGQWIINNPKDASFIESRGEQMLGDTLIFSKNGNYDSPILIHDKFTWSVDADSVVTIWDNVNSEAIQYKYYIHTGELNIEWGNNGFLLKYHR